MISQDRHLAINPEDALHVFELEFDEALRFANIDKLAFLAILQTYYVLEH